MAKIKPAELTALSKKDIFAFGIQNIDLLEDKVWEYRPWMPALYNAVNPYYIELDPVGRARRLSVIKSTQSGISTMSLVRTFHAAINWKVRIMFTLPRDQDAYDMVITRVDPMITNSPLLSSKLGLPDNTSTKRIGDSYIFFMYLTIEPRSMPGDLIFIDEVDLSDPDNLRTALNRLDASKWKLNYYISTPTISNFGIDALYKDSDMRRWMVQCTHCNEWQTMDWNKNVRVTGDPSTPKDVQYICHKCKKIITTDDIANGRWIPERPDRTPEHIGFHISQMMTTDALSLWKIFRDPQTNLVEFWRKRLGTPYEIGGGSVSRDDFLVNCFDTPYEFETYHDGESRYFLGCDQGNELQVIVGKKEPNSERIKIVHIEIIPPEIGFGRVHQLMNLFQVRRAVIDANPNRHKSIEMQKDFPGKMLIADYVEQKKRFNTTKSKRELPYDTNVSINRTTAFDDVLDAIKKGLFQLPGTPPVLPQDVELLIDQTTALKRDIEFRKTRAGGEVPAVVYRSIRADHLGHSMLYLKTAVDIDAGGSGRVAIIGNSAPTEEEVEDKYELPDEKIRSIIRFLAEIPKDQLSSYIANKNNDDYAMPFPFSYKFGRALEKHTLEEVEYVISILLNPKKYPEYA